LAQRQVVASLQAELAKTKRLLAAQAAAAPTAADAPTVDATDDAAAGDGAAGGPSLTKLLAAHHALQDLLGDGHPQVVDMQRSIDEARAAKRAAKPIDVQVREAERVVTKCRKAVATTQAEATAAQQAAAAAVAAATAASGLAETARAQLQTAEAVRAALLLQRSAAAASSTTDTASASEALARLAALIPATEAQNPTALADLAAVRLLLSGLVGAPTDDAASDAGTETASLAMDLDDAAIDRMAEFFRAPAATSSPDAATNTGTDEEQRFELVRSHARSKRKELATTLLALRPSGGVRQRIGK
jgi:hypothetical protein